MKKNYLKNRIRSLFSNLLQSIYDIENCKSVSLVGSFSNKFDFNKVSDIDIVIVSASLNKILYKKIIKKISKYKSVLLKLSKKNKILINNNLGPLKFNNKETLVFHIMIYDFASHKDHVLKSPFTCFDWERSNFFKGIKLKNIYPVITLQFDDFFKSRRGTFDYLKDLKSNRISYLQLFFKINEIYYKKKYFKITIDEKKIIFISYFYQFNKKFT